MSQESQRSHAEPEIELLRQQVRQLEAEREQLCSETTRLQAECELQRKALQACLPESCSVEEAAEWVDIMQQYHQGTLIPVADLMAEMTRLEQGHDEQAA